MEEHREYVQKTVLLNRNNEAVFVCDNCGTFQKIDESRYRTGSGQRIPLECQKCHRWYSIFVNLRKTFRKKVKLQGTFKHLSAAWSTAGEIEIEDISRTGLNFRAKGSVKLAVGDEIRLRFVLDDANTSAVEKDAVVRRIHRDLIGVEFAKPISEREPDLAFYIM